MHRFNDALPDSYYADQAKAQCDQCQRTAVADDMALLNGMYFCSRCLDPLAPAFDLVVSIVEHLEAEVMSLRAEARKLNAQLNAKERKAA